MPPKKDSKTRKKILEAACQLFSEHGQDSVSTRMIADKAKVHLPSIHYYFGDKESLYIEVFRLASQSSDVISLDPLLEDNPQLLDTPEGKAKAIYQSVVGYFDNCFTKKEEWKKRLVLREINQNSPVSAILAEEVFKPRVEKCRELYRMLASKDSETDSFLWGHLPNYIAGFYLLAKPTLHRVFDEEYVTTILSKLGRLTAKIMILLLELPLPEELKEIQ